MEGIEFSESYEVTVKFKGKKAKFSFSEYTLKAVKDQRNYLGFMLENAIKEMEKGERDERK